MCRRVLGSLTFCDITENFKLLYGEFRQQVEAIETGQTSSPAPFLRSRGLGLMLHCLLHRVTILCHSRITIDDDLLGSS